MSIKLICVVMISTIALGAGDSANRPAGVDKGSTEGTHRVIVRMAGRDKTLTILSGPRGRLYSVNDASGKVLLSLGTMDDLRAKHPDLWRQVNSGVASSEKADGVLIDASVNLDAGF